MRSQTPATTPIRPVNDGVRKCLPRHPAGGRRMGSASACLVTPAAVCGAMAVSGRGRSAPTDGHGCQWVTTMGYVFDFHDARAYERWFEDPRNRFEAEMECRLMLSMLKPARGESVLDIGCGTGNSLTALVQSGLSVTGIDPSPYMLDIAHKQLGSRAELYRGQAEDLPFGDNSFNHACFMTTLEFVQDPALAIEEACRVSKDRVFIGVLNRYAIKGIQRRLAGMFARTLFNQARFFGIWELKRMARAAAGPVPLAWRTVNQFPAACSPLARNIEQSRIVQRCPFGAFVGMVVTLVPQFRTRPLAIRYHTNQATG